MTEPPPDGTTPPDDLTPPGPSVEPDSEESDPPTRGGLSVDEWLVTRQVGPAAQTNPYVGAPRVAAPARWRPLDQMSLAAFLVSLTGVGTPIAAVLGFVGIRRTADGTRAGRWAAVSGVVIGLVGTLGLLAAVPAIAWFRDHVKSVERVEAGECVDVDDSDGVSFQVGDCDESHQAEVVAAGDLDLQSLRSYNLGSAAEFCYEQVDEHYQLAARTGRYLVTVVVGAPDPDNPAVGDAFACYFERADRQSLTEAIDTARPGNV